MLSCFRLTIQPPIVFLIRSGTQMPDAYGSVGAMTHSFVRALECEPRGVTYGRLLISMRTIMKCGGSYDDLQGPIGAPMQHHQVANFSGVQVSSDGLRRSCPTIASRSDPRCYLSVPSRSFSLLPLV